MSHAFSQSAFAKAVTQADAALPRNLTTARGTPDAARFAVYRNNVAVSLIKALETRFPVVRSLVGDDFFRAMARGHVERHKPSSPLMFRYGEAFPDFIDGFEPAAGLPYLGDVARIEAAYTNAYHAADAEPLTVSALACVPGKRLAQARMSPHPSATLLASRHPAASLWAAHQAEIVTPPACWQAETAIVVRPGMEVKVHIIPKQDVGFAIALLAGRTLGAAALAGTDPAFDFGTALVGLVSLGTFTAIQFHGDST